jgi:hypothetical protein
MLTLQTKNKQRLAATRNLITFFVKEYVNRLKSLLFSKTFDV